MTHEDFIKALTNVTKFIDKIGQKSLRSFSIEALYLNHIIVTFQYPTIHIKFDDEISIIDPLKNHRIVFPHLNDEFYSFTKSL
jgi:hypothetical protein